MNHRINFCQIKISKKLLNNKNKNLKKNKLINHKKCNYFLKFKGKKSGKNNFSQKIKKNKKLKRIILKIKNE